MIHRVVWPSEPLIWRVYSLPFSLPLTTKLAEYLYLPSLWPRFELTEYFISMKPEIFSFPSEFGIASSANHYDKQVDWPRPRPNERA